jgi:hypothetical protein
MLTELRNVIEAAHRQQKILSGTYGAYFPSNASIYTVGVMGTIN